MNQEKWRDILVLRAAADAWYQECLRAVKEKETDFLQLHRKLTEPQRGILDGYLAVCEELEYALVQLAYELGKEDAAEIERPSGKPGGR